MLCATIFVSFCTGSFFTILSIFNGYSLPVCLATYILASLCGMLLTLLHIVERDDLVSFDQLS